MKTIKLPMKDTIALIEKWDKMPITAQWINDEFLSTRLKSMLPGIQQKTMITITKAENDSKEAKSDEQALSELPQQASKLSRELRDHLFKHAIYTHKQLEDVAMQAGGSHYCSRSWEARAQRRPSPSIMTTSMLLRKALRQSGNRLNWRSRVT